MRLKCGAWLQQRGGAGGGVQGGGRELSDRAGERFDPVDESQGTRGTRMLLHGKENKNNKGKSRTSV